MVIAFYALIVLIVVALVIYALLLAVPILAVLAVDLWNWWASIPVSDMAMSQVSSATGTSFAGFWDPWGAAAALVFIAVLLAAVIRYVPRIIAGEL